MSATTTATPMIEELRDGHRVLACIICAGHRAEETKFVTPPEWNQQVGFVVYPAGASIPRHRHCPMRREIVGTGEVLIVRSGRCELDLFADDDRHVLSRELRAGDVLILIAGGHGFRMLEDTVLLEVKQGPYTGLAEKVFF